MTSTFMRVGDDVLQKAVVEGVRRMLAADLAWTALHSASDLMGLPDKVILHAGTPVDSNICAPIRNSAAMAIFYEAWAGDEAATFRMIDIGEILLRTAQVFNALVTLPAVLSQSILLHVIADRNYWAKRCFTPLNGVRWPAMRQGKRGADVVGHLCWIIDTFAQTLDDTFSCNMQPVPIANEALKRGDDLHGGDEKLLRHATWQGGANAVSATESELLSQSQDVRLQIHGDGRRRRHFQWRRHRTGAQQPQRRLEDFGAAGALVHRSGDTAGRNARSGLEAARRVCAIIDKTGDIGRIGGGIQITPLKLFTAAGNSVRATG
jgi:Protein of unknown function (DUF1116)